MAFELRKDLELVDVQYENNGKKAVLTFLDRERREIRPVSFNRQSYDNGKYVDDADKAAKVDQWCADYFQTTFDGLPGCIGQKHDVYCYDRFNSVFECSVVEKFTKDMVGQIFQTEVSEVIVDDTAIRMRYNIDGKLYESKMGYATYFEATKEWYQDPVKRAAQYQKFADKYGVPVERAQELIGHPLMVEVKVAFGSCYYGDVKRFPKR